MLHEMYISSNSDNLPDKNFKPAPASQIRVLAKNVQSNMLTYETKNSIIFLYSGILRFLKFSVHITPNVHLLLLSR